MTRAVGGTERIVVRIEFGSHLYGTSTTSSDRDYKSVYVPSAADILLQRVKGSLGHKVKRYVKGIALLIEKWARVNSDAQPAMPHDPICSCGHKRSHHDIMYGCGIILDGESQKCACGGYLAAPLAIDQKDAQPAWIKEYASNLTKEAELHRTSCADTYDLQAGNTHCAALLDSISEELLDHLKAAPLAIDRTPDKLCPECHHPLTGDGKGKCSVSGCECEADRPVRKAAKKPLGVCDTDHRAASLQGAHPWNASSCRNWRPLPTVDDSLRFLRKLEQCTSDAAKLILLKHFVQRGASSVASAPPRYQDWGISATRYWLDKFGESARGNVTWDFACSFAEDFARKLTREAD